MFLKNSRYYKLENIAKADDKGRVFESKKLRLLPAAVGEYQHIVEDTDRLDNLAQKYYKKPAQWWRICDANPEYYSPRSLLGKQPTKITQFDVQWIGLQAPWFELRSGLNKELGVERVLFGSEEQLYPEEDVFELGFLFSMNSSLLLDIDQSIYIQLLTPALHATFLAAGFEINQDIHFTKVESNFWQLVDQTTKLIFSIRLQEGVLNIYESRIRFTWSLTVDYNAKNIIADEIYQKVETLLSPGFTVLSTAVIGRTGKPIIVPPITQGKVN